MLICFLDMAKEAITKALADASVQYNEIQQVVVGYVYGMRTARAHQFTLSQHQRARGERTSGVLTPCNYAHAH